jgi:hypothetical protein
MIAKGRAGAVENSLRLPKFAEKRQRASPELDVLRAEARVRAGEAIEAREPFEGTSSIENDACVGRRRTLVGREFPSGGDVDSIRSPVRAEVPQHARAGDACVRLAPGFRSVESRGDLVRRLEQAAIARVVNALDRGAVGRSERVETVHLGSATLSGSDGEHQHPSLTPAQK